MPDDAADAERALIEYVIRETQRAIRHALNEYEWKMQRGGQRTTPRSEPFLTSGARARAGRTDLGRAFGAATSPGALNVLAAYGYTPTKVRAASDEELLALPGFGHVSLVQVRKR